MIYFFCISWILIGCVGVFISMHDHYRRGGDILVQDIVVGIVMTCLGPILALKMLYDCEYVLVKGKKK